MQPIVDQPNQEHRRMILTLRAPAEAMPTKPAPGWALIDAVAAATGLVVAGWLLAPVVIVLRATGHYRRIPASHPELGDRRIGWLGRPPVGGIALTLPARLVPFLVFDLAKGAVSLRPSCRTGWASYAPMPQGSNQTIVDLRSNSLQRTDHYVDVSRR